MEIVSQAIFAAAPTSYTITLGRTKESTRAAANGNDLITSSPGLSVLKLTTTELWSPPPILPHYKNIHLVVLSHGLHSNLTADMLYLKDRLEQIAGITHRPDGGIIVLGYKGNVCKTERGVKYLGKRMARWLLRETLWLDQLGCFAPDAPPYSRISFIGHSLGGVVQNYAIAMIELLTHGEFFQKLKPVNLITLAAPWLGVSAENPAYVKLVLDMGFVGRTGQDLGMMSRLGQKLEGTATEQKIRDSRPILRLLALPNSPCHRVVKRFLRRTIYANVINDGIVPLRTSAMFFLDWSSFDTVQKSVGQAGVFGSLVGMPNLEMFFDGFERIFTPRKLEDDASSSKESERPSGEEDRRPSFSIPSLFRKRPTLVPPSTPPLQQRSSSEAVRPKTSPPLKAHSPDLAKEVADAMVDRSLTNVPSHSISSPTTQADNAKIETSKDEGDTQDDQQYAELSQTSSGSTSASEDESSKTSQNDHTTQHETENTEAQRPQLTISIESPQVIDQEPSEQSSMQMNAKASPSNQIPHILSDEFVQSPSVQSPGSLSPRNHSSSQVSNETGDNEKGQPVDHGATGPPKVDGIAEGDQPANPISAFFQHLRPQSGKKAHMRRISKVYHRSQTLTKSSGSNDVRPPPPRTSFLESFPSLINPPLPDAKFITQPSSRPKTIFHDRLYTPDDIPPVSLTTTDANNGTDEQITKREKLRLEEKIARDWHSDMTWRKVLVKLEPDAHNNIIVRRMFPNAYGWPVVEHLVREHFVHDPEGLESEFVQEWGVVPLNEEEGPKSPSWKSPLADSEADSLETSFISERDSVGRALMSDEEDGEVLEMKDMSGPNTHSDNNEREQEGSSSQQVAGNVDKQNPFEIQFT